MPVKVDIVILSYAKTDELKQITLRGIESLFASEDPAEIQFEVLVIESNKSMQPYQYPGTKTLYPDTAFGFNKYLNIGINATSNNYIGLCNNDLLYHKNWASEIIKAMDNDSAMLSATPYCPVYHKGAGFAGDGPAVEGYYGTFIGWCFFVKREIFSKMGMLDEKFIFWYSDADYCQTLVKYNIKNCLVPTSVVTHLGSESLKSVSSKEQQKLTQLPRLYYSYKWLHRSALKYQLQLLLYKFKRLTGL